MHDAASLQYGDRSLQHRKILNGIAVEYDQVGKFPSRYRTDLVVYAERHGGIACGRREDRRR